MADRRRQQAVERPQAADPVRVRPRLLAQLLDMVGRRARVRPQPPQPIRVRRVAMNLRHEVDQLAVAVMLRHRVGAAGVDAAGNLPSDIDTAHNIRGSRSPARSRPCAAGPSTSSRRHGSRPAHRASRAAAPALARGEHVGERGAQGRRRGARGGRPGHPHIAERGPPLRRGRLLDARGVGRRAAAPRRRVPG